MSDKYSYLKDLLIPMHYGNLKRYGDDRDGGYIIAEDLLNETQIAYSYGIGAEACDIKFDLSLAAAGKLVYQYDGSIEKPAIELAQFIFKKEHVTSLNFPRHISSNGHNRETNMLLKMDIEGDEYLTLLNCPDHIFSHFNQVAIEVHDLIIGGYNTNPRSEINKAAVPMKIAFFRRLLKFYHLVHIHGNNNAALLFGMPDVVELLFVRRDCMPGSPEKCTRACPVIGLDYPNRNDRDDYRLDWWI